MTAAQRVMQLNTGVAAIQSFDARKNFLSKLYNSIKTHEYDIYAALKADFNKSRTEAYMTEVLMTLEEIRHALKHLKGWMRPKRVSAGLANFPAHGKIIPQSFGTALVMSPWNYPFMLSMAPFIGAIAAGNTVLLKPSDYSKNVSELLKIIVEEVFPPEIAQVALGGRAVNQDILDCKFDIVFFTGGETVGRLVMQKAAENLTPVVLELGGKSPVIVDASANLEIAARRIVWSKMLNGGQTCVAPDYLLCDKRVKGHLLEHLVDAVKEFYYCGDILSTDFPQIINDRQFEKCSALIDNYKVVFGGKYYADTRVIEPTIMDNVALTDAVMQQEIFAPILPIITVDDMAQAVKIVNDRPRPLALYLFSRDKKNIDYVLSSTRCGGGCVNDCVMHLSTPNLPFGGIGASGMGRYHGYQTFATFSHFRSVLFKSPSVDLNVKYPPYTEKKFNTIKTLMGK